MAGEIIPVARKNVVPPEVAAAIQSGQGGVSTANLTDVPPDVPSGNAALPEPIPQNVLDALASGNAPAVPPAPSFVPNQPHNESPTPDVLPSLVSQSATTPRPQLAPHHRTFGEKLRAALPYIGAVGGAMEAAGGPVGARPEGAEMLERSIAAQRAAAAKRAELEQVEIPKAKATVDYLSGKNETAAENAKTAAQSRLGVAGVNAQSRTDVANINANSKSQIAALQNGAGMVIQPEMAQIAGQPQFAGKTLSGKSLANFMKMYTATGAAVHDLGDEGMWSVDRAGNRIKQITVSSPSVARANAFAESKAKNTPTNVLRMDENGNPYMAAVSQAEQLKTGEPTASTENSVLGPTGDMRNKAAIAERAKQTGQRVLEDLKDPNIRGKLGPLVGRFGNLENVIGNMPPELAETAQDLKSFAQFVGGQHPVRGLNALEAFEKSIGGIGQNADTLEAKISSQLKTSDFVSNQGTVRPNRPGAARQPAAKGGGSAQPTHVVKDASGNRIGTVINGAYVPDRK